MLAAPTNSSEKSLAPATTSWVSVLLAIAAGVMAAFQLGKVHIGLPSIRQSFSLGLVSASWILSALNIVGLFTATPVGSLSARIGNKRAVVFGLVAVAISSAFGALSPTLAWLIVSRLVEGIGFVVIVVAAPSMVVEVTSAEDIRLALAGWSAYMPGGIALISLIAPLLLVHHTWRSVWWLNSILLAVLAIAIALFARVPPRSPAHTAQLRPWHELGSVLSARGPVLLAIIFGMYTMQHLSVMGFLPTLLLERFHVPEAQMGVLVSVAMASNILGNLAAGALLQRGVSRAKIIALTSVFMILMTIGMFLLHLPLAGFYTCALGFSCVGGLIPSAVMGAAPFYTPTPSLLGATNGLLVQGSNLGIVLGPPILSVIATRLGWSWVPLMTGLCAIAAIALALALKPSSQAKPSLVAAHSIE